ncbi:MAG: class I SAM-dependent methyltransferase [Pseudomonadales bacterium]|nr:class I SAM-dependent methyltransferase [Pseudomonadales bacterium]
MRFLIFILICILLSPLLIVGLIYYTWRIRRICVRQNISGTANEPYASRLMMHLAGTRQDDAAYKIAGHLPSFDKLSKFLLMETLGFASNLSGYKGSMFAYPGERPSTLMGMMSHRTEFFDRSIRDSLTRSDNPAVQFVVLGAGYDTRCYDLPDGLDIQCFEVDMPPTLNSKISALKSAGVPHDHVTFVETDFNQETWMDALLASGFNPNLTTYILWEGVTMYLVEEAIHDTLNLVFSLPKGSTVGVDFFSADLVKGNPPYTRMSKAMHKALKYYSETIQFGVATGETLSEGIEELVRESGLTLSKFEHIGSEEDKFPPWYFFSHIENL